MMKMTEEELNTQLYVRMFEEQERFRDELLGMSPQDILDNAYKYVMREDLLLALEYNDLSEKQCRALLKTETPLADLFERWSKYEGSHMKEVWDVIQSHADEAIRKDFLRSRREER
jgi:hypothetical protein